MNKSVLTFASGNYYVLRSMSIGPDFCYNVCRDLLTCRAPSKGAVCYTRSAAALPHSRLKGVTHIGRRLKIGVTYSSIEERTIACRVSLTDALLHMLDLVLIYLSTRSPSSTDVPSE